MKNFLVTSGTWGIPLPLIQCRTLRPTLREDVGMLGLAFQINCPVFIPHRQLGIYFLDTKDSYSLTCARISVSQCSALTNKLATHVTEFQCWSVVVIYVEVSSWVETLVQSPACKMNTRETPATKAADAAGPQRVYKDLCALTILKTPLSQEEIILEQSGMCYPLWPGNREDTQYTSHFSIKDSVCHK